jgi:hypothetical protein
MVIGNDLEHFSAGPRQSHGERHCRRRSRPDRPGHRAPCRCRAACRARRPERGQRERGGRGDAKRRLRGERHDCRRVVPHGRASAHRDCEEPGRDYGAHPRGRRLAVAGIAGHDPARGSLRHGGRTRGVWHCHGARRVRRRDLVTVWPPTARALRGAESGARAHAHGEAAPTPLSPARPGEGLAARGCRSAATRCA